MAASDLTAKSAWHFTDHPIVALLYAMIVSPDVQVSDLSSTTLQDIYQGNITNWSRPKIVSSFSCRLLCVLTVMYIVPVRTDRRDKYKMQKTQFP